MPWLGALQQAGRNRHVDVGWDNCLSTPWRMIVELLNSPAGTRAGAHRDHPLGSSIWSSTSRSSTAIVCTNQPDTIIRSAWRGEELRLLHPKARRSRGTRRRSTSSRSRGQELEPNVTSRVDFITNHATSLLQRRQPTHLFVPLNLPARSTSPFRLPERALNSDPPGHSARDTALVDPTCLIQFKNLPPPDVNIQTTARDSPRNRKRINTKLLSRSSTNHKQSGKTISISKNKRSRSW